MEEWIMATQYSEDFKKDTLTYWKEHPELGINNTTDYYRKQLMY